MRPFPRLIVGPFVALLVLAAAPATARAAEFSQDIPLDGVVTEHPCTGEVVVLRGHLKFHSQTNADGTVQIHIEMHGVSATTVPIFPGEKPRKYVCDETQNQTTQFDPDGPADMHTVYNFTFVRTGETGGAICCGDDFHLHVNFKLELTDDVTIPELDDFEGECK